MAEKRPYVLPAWIAFFALPMVAFAERLAYQQSHDHVFGLFAHMDIVEANNLIRRAPNLELAGMVAAALVILLLGPHLAAMGSVTVVVASAGLIVGGSAAGAHDLLAIGHGAATVGIVATVGASATGATPGLRYGTMFATFAAMLIGNEIAPYAATLTPWAGIGAGALAVATLVVPTLTWWFNKRPLRQPSEGASLRTFGAAVALFCVIFTTLAAFSLLDPAYAAAQVGLWALAEPVTQIGIALALAVWLALVQLFKGPARIGVLGGVGAMLVAIAATLTWSWGDDAPMVPLLVLAAVGEVLLLPWAWSRATSDAHWRLTGILAVLVLLPYSLSGPIDTLAAIGAAMVLSVAAIPIGGLGWMADEWVFGDVLGTAQPRGRR